MLFHSDVRFMGDMQAVVTPLFTLHIIYLMIIIALQTDVCDSMYSTAVFKDGSLQMTTSPPHTPCIDHPICLISVLEKALQYL